MASIQWNEKGQRIIAPLERDRFERGQPPRRLPGRLELAADGNVWYREGTHQRHVGSVIGADLAHDEPAAETGASEAPAKPQRKRASKPRARKQR